MKRSRRNLLTYLLMLLVLGSLIFGALKTGEYHATSFALSIDRDFSHGFFAFLDALRSNLGAPIAVLLVQILVILVVSRFCAAIFRFIGQPGVIGEIIAGIVLGPSLLGWVWPEAYQTLFRPESLGILEQVSNIGLLLFMFVIGLEVDFNTLRNKMNTTIVISHGGIFSSFFLGILASLFFYKEYAAATTAFLPFALFMGISISITAFPVLARIIQERGMTRKPVGITALACAANDDVTAWCLLALVISISKATTLWTTLYTLLGTLLYFAIMFLVVRPLLKKIGELYANPEVIDKRFVNSIFLVLVLSAATTEVLGIHALLGAFLAGVVMPANLGFRKVMTEKIEDVASVFFLPLFFAFMGLRTEIGLINTPESWIMGPILFLMAIGGKLGGCSLAARAVGQSWKNSLIIGTLMNTRGLMELVVINIGYEMGILPPPVFVMLVLMALVTTFMTTPLLSLVEFIFQRRKRSHIQKLREERAKNSQGNAGTEGKLLLCFGRPDTGYKLLRIFYLLYGPKLGGKTLLAAHYTLGTDVNPSNAELFANESFRPISKEAERLKIGFEKIYRTTDSFVNEAKQLIRAERPSMILLGAGPRFMSTQEMPLRAVTPFFSLFRGKTESILSEAECTVGIYSSRKETSATANPSLAILLGTHADDFLLDYLPGLLNCSPLSPETPLCDIHIYRLKEYSEEESGSHNAAYVQLAADYSERIHLHPVEKVTELAAPLLPEGIALMLLSYDTCRQHIAESPVFSTLPSLLVLKKGSKETRNA